METTTDIRPKDKMIALSESAVSALSAALPEVVANAKAQLQQLDIPTTRNEEWKYTRTTRIAAESWSIQKDTNSNGLENTIIDNLDAIRIVFINGFFSAENSAISAVEGLTILSNENITAENLKKFNVASPANFFEALQQTRKDEDITLFREFMYAQYEKYLQQEIEKFEQAGKSGKGFSFVF